MPLRRQYPVHQFFNIGAFYDNEEYHEYVNKIGITLYDLKTGKPYSFYPSYREKQLKENQEMKQYNSDCSGRHIAFIAECIALNYPMEGYDSPEHPIQKDILKLISDITRIPERDIVVGNDGCGVPVHAVPIKNMAMAYARFTTPENLPKEYRDGAKIIAESMCNEPDMIAAPGDFCTELLRVTKGKFIGKLGADGLFLVGVRGRDMGIAVKIEDGDVFTALYPVVMSTLDQLGLLSDEEKSALKDFSETPLLSDHGTVVGNVRPVFKLRRP